MNVLKVTKSGCLSHVGRRTASLRTSCAVPGSVGGAEKADCVALRRPAVCGVSKNRRERSQADADSWNGLFDTQDGPQRAYRAYRFNGSYSTCRRVPEWKVPFATSGTRGPFVQ